MRGHGHIGPPQTKKSGAQPPPPPVPTPMAGHIVSPRALVVSVDICLGGLFHVLSLTAVCVFHGTPCVSLCFDLQLVLLFIS